jgi:hypothetical protein
MGMKAGISACWKNINQVVTNVVFRRILGPKGEEVG